MKQFIALATIVVAAHAAAVNKDEVLDQAEALVKELSQASTLDKK